MCEQRFWSQTKTIGDRNCTACFSLASAGWYDFRSDTLTFFPKNLLHFWLALQDGEIFGSISYGNPTSLKVFCSEQSSSRGGIEIAQLVADWLIRLPIRTCVKPPVTSDCSLAPKHLFVDWLKILDNEKQAVQFRSPIVLVCEQKRCTHMPGTRQTYFSKTRGKLFFLGDFGH